MRKFLFVLLVLISFVSIASANDYLTGNIKSGKLDVSAPVSPYLTPHILFTSFSANPGDYFNIVGDLSSNATVYIKDPIGFGSSPMILPAVSTTPNTIQVQLPTNFSLKLWEVYVVRNDNNAMSNVKYLNQTSIWDLDFGQAVQGGAVFIKGRNLVLNSAEPGKSQIILVDANGVQYSCVVTQGDLYEAKATIPSDLPPGLYTVYAANGLENNTLSLMGKYWEGQLTVRAPGSAGIDPLHLAKVPGDIPWATDYTYVNNQYNVMTDPRLAKNSTYHCGGTYLPNPYPAGDGVTNDQQAIQCAINLASNQGGGVVYLPANTYVVDTPLNLPPNVVLMGAATTPPTTNILYGMPGYGNWAVQTSQANVSGIMNINFSNPTASYRAFYGTQHGAIDIENRTGNLIQDFVLKNDQFEYSYSNFAAVMVNNYANVYAGDTSILSTGGSMGAYFQQDPYLLLDGDTIQYSNGRLYLNASDHARIINSTIIHDTSFEVPDDQGAGGGPQTNFGQNIFVGHDTIEALGNADSTKNDNGEIINTEMSNHSFANYAGTLTAVSGNTFTDNTASFPNDFYTQPTVYENAKAFFLNGPALGESCTIISNTPTSFTCKENLEIEPVPGTVYTIEFPAGENEIIYDNIIENAMKYVDIIGGADRLVVANNTLTNSQGIALFAWEDTPETGCTQTLCARGPLAIPLFQADVLDNQLIATADGSPFNNQAWIFVCLSQNGGVDFGTPILDVRLMGNSIQCLTNDCGMVNEDGTTNTYWKLFAIGDAGEYPSGIMAFRKEGNQSVEDFETAPSAAMVIQDNTVSGVPSNLYAFVESPDMSQVIVDSGNMSIAPANLKSATLLDAPVFGSQNPVFSKINPLTKRIKY